MRNGDDTHGEGDRGSRGWSSGKEGPSAKIIVAIAAIVLVVVLALQNLRAAETHVLFWDFSVPLWIVIATPAVIGFVVGWLFGRASGRRKVIEKLTD